MKFTQLNDAINEFVIEFRSLPSLARPVIVSMCGRRPKSQAGSADQLGICIEFRALMVYTWKRSTYQRSFSIVSLSKSSIVTIVQSDQKK